MPEPNQMTVNVFNNNAQKYEQNYMDISSYKNSLDVFLDLLPSLNSDLLEVACGPGNITKYLLNQKPRLKILATDMAPNMLKLAEKNAPLAKFDLLNAKDIIGLDNIYNGIVCGFIFPYFSQEECSTFIQHAAKILNHNGLIYLSTMAANQAFRMGWS